MGKTVPPDAFSVVMATGIVSIAARDHDYPYLDIPLAAIATAAFVGLSVGLGRQVLTHPRSSFRLARRPDIALRLFTFVAACAVLGARFVAVPRALWPLAVAAVGSWLVLLLLAFFDVRSRPRVEIRQQAHGAWLLVSVATGGLAITAADLGDRTRWPGWLVLSGAAWILAVLLYIPIAGLIIRRAGAGLAPEQVTPDSWILMGALAIDALAGVHLRGALVSHGSGNGWVDTTGPAIFILWVLAALWTPLLLYAELWRLDRKPGSVRFTGSWWSAVFPLGMFSSATEAVGRQLHVPALTTVSLVLFWNAFTLFVLVAAGWLHSLARSGKELSEPRVSGTECRATTAPGTARRPHV
jgi:tellurite resistance protein TehA-like permease